MKIGANSKDEANPFFKSFLLSLSSSPSASAGLQSIEKAYFKKKG